MTIGYTNASWTLKADLVSRLRLPAAAAHGRAPASRSSPRSRRPTRRRRAASSTCASGYVQRSLDALPKQGARAPWRLHQNYIRDVLLMRRGPLDDEGMRFSRATRAPVRPDPSRQRGPPDEHAVRVRSPAATAVVTGAASGIGAALAAAARRAAAATWSCSTGTPTGWTRSPPRSAPTTRLARSTRTSSTSPTRRATARVAAEIGRRHPRVRAAGQQRRRGASAAGSTR